MSAVLVVLGVTLVAAALLDAVVTTLSAGSGGGPITTRLTGWAWRGLRAASSGGGSRALAHSGTVVLLVTVLTWVLLQWAGWTLVFLASDRAVLDATTSAPAPVAARVYYAGFVVFTLGVGDYVAGTGTWQVLTAVASFLGLFLITLAITYLVSVVSAAVTRRALARDIHLSGPSGVDIVQAHWTGTAVSSQFESLAQTLGSQIVEITQQHLAYPVLHHFHAADDASSAPRALAALDDALLVLSAGLDPQVRPGADTLLRLRRVLEHYASTVHGGGGSAQEPPLPDLAALRDVGIPVVPDADFAVAARSHAERRRQVNALVQADAWTWPRHSAQH